MTETLSHIAIKKLNHPPSKHFKVLENINILKDKRNCLVIDAPEFANEPLLTNDVIELKNKDHFEWLGRYDNVINSGGIKIIPEQIEIKIQQLIKQPFYITATQDELLGEKMVLLIESDTQLDTITLKKQLAKILKKHQMPKEIIILNQFERTTSGKIKRTKF